MVKRMHMIPIVVILLTLLTYPGIAKTAREYYTYWVNIEYWIDIGESKSENLFLLKLSSPGAGEEVLPKPVLEVLRLLRQNNISSYRYASSVEKNPLLVQRIIEGAYPIRNDPASPFLVLLGTDVLPNSCMLMDRWEGARLAYCP